MVIGTSAGGLDALTKLICQLGDNLMKVDYCLPIAEMGGLLYQLFSRKLGKQKAMPQDILIESEIAKHVLSDLPSVNALGEQVPFNCPGCGGVLWKIDQDSANRYRCHTGHAYTAAALLAEQTKKIEETMWVALRMFEERKNLLTTIAKDQTGASSKSSLERQVLPRCILIALNQFYMPMIRI